MLKSYVPLSLLRKKKVRFRSVPGLDDIATILNCVEAENYYFAFVQVFPLIVITTEGAADAAERFLEYISKAFGANPSIDVKLYRDALASLLANYESQHYIQASSQISPSAFLHALLQEEGFHQKDLVPDCFSSASQVSEFLHQKKGRDKLSWEQAIALGNKFHVDSRNFLPR